MRGAREAPFGAGNCPSRSRKLFGPPLFRAFLSKSAPCSTRFEPQPKPSPQTDVSRQTDVSARRGVPSTLAPPAAAPRSPRAWRSRKPLLAVAFATAGCAGGAGTRRCCCRSSPPSSYAEEDAAEGSMAGKCGDVFFASIRGTQNVPPSCGANRQQVSAARVFDRSVSAACRRPDSHTGHTTRQAQRESQGAGRRGGTHSSTACCRRRLLRRRPLLRPRYLRLVRHRTAQRSPTTRRQPPRRRGGAAPHRLVLAEPLACGDRGGVALTPPKARHTAVSLAYLGQAVSIKRLVFRFWWRRCGLWHGDPCVHEHEDGGDSDRHRREESGTLR